MMLQLYQLYKCVQLNSRGCREILADDPRSGDPATATTEENIDHIQHNDGLQTINCDQIAYAVGIS